ncbi:MAG: hypothetical protein ABF263_07940 [Polaribacter sp.]
MLSYTDILRISFADISDDENNVDTFVYDIREFHTLPVAKNGELFGIITSTDLINFLVQQL